MLAAMETRFAPAERSTPAEIGRQAAVVSTDAVVRAFVDVIPDIFLILNRNRQILFANKAALNFLGAKNAQTLMGQRPGEALGCARAAECVGGCGTSEYCRVCGAVQAILTSLQGQSSMQDCRITRKANVEPLDLRVWSKPLTVKGEPFSGCVFSDIAGENQRKRLERIFFHDVLNTVTAMNGFISLLDQIPNEDGRQYRKTLSRLSETLVEEIHSQRDLLLAEASELRVRPCELRSISLFEESAQGYQHLAAARHIAILLRPDCADAAFVSDATLLRRVIGNMIKNALEASKSGETVTLGCEAAEGEVRLSVHNPAVMSEDVRLQVYSRSFSTKGDYRGLGTYGMKLLTERYLKGRISFTSEPGRGTTFVAAYPFSLG